MGEVFLGHDPRLDRRVALKCLTSAEADSPDGHARILREARAAARLTHANIAGVYDVLEEGGRTYIVMEYVEGVSLSAYLAGGPRPPAEVRSIGRQLASALAAAHAQGVVHRDLKPSNIQVMSNGSIKVLDFGVARLTAMTAGTLDSTTGALRVDMTVQGNPGTPIYMAPEQLIGQPADARSDLYSAGVILFLVATGRRPYLETTAVTLALAMNAAPAPDARSINPLIPIELSDTIRRLLERNPDDRMQSARELEAALGAMSGNSSVTRALPLRSSSDSGTLPRALARVWTMVAAGATLLIIAAIAREPLSHLRWPLESAVPNHPAVLAILPVEHPNGDPHTEYLAAGIWSVVAQNLGSVRGLSVLSRASTAPFETQRGDISALHKQLGAAYVLDMTMLAPPPAARLLARLRTVDKPMPVWEQTFQGDLLALERLLLDGIGRALESRDAMGRRFMATEWEHIRKLPTTSPDALSAYSEARSLIDRDDVPGNIDRSISLLQRAIKADSSFALAHAALGDAYLRLFQAKKDASAASLATDAVRRAIALDPNQAPIYYSLGVLQQQTGHPDDAVKALRRAIELQPDNDDSHRVLGRVLADKGQVDEGVAELNDAIRIRPTFWNNYFTLGFVLYNAGRYEFALEAYRRTTELRPDHAGAFQMLGTVQYVLGTIDQAIGNFEHAVRLGPSAAAYSNLAFAYFTADRYEDALQAYEAALKQSPRSPLNHRNIADVYQRLGRTADAKAAYATAIELAEATLVANPRDSSAIMEMALSEARLGRRSQAERHAAEGIALEPTNRNVRERSAKVHVALEQYDAALDDLAAAIEHGYDRRLARLDKELEALRSSPRFQAITASAAGSSGAAGR